MKHKKNHLIRDRERQRERERWRGRKNKWEDKHKGTRITFIYKSFHYAKDKSYFILPSSA